ncbi:sulfite exporter TauE/SafE family protein [Candidatus Woesearchaeota archaeon]|nr:sulfite exporter TauE/SafE family protein [Candidatus Woesearchaeota archaeon]
MDALSFALLLAAGFLASVMGTMMGMAMVVLIPVMSFLGVPIHTAVATGRFSMVGLGLGNIGKLSRGEKIEFKYVLPFAISGIFGTLVGASFLKLLSEDSLKTVIGAFVILVSVLVLFEGKMKPRAVRHEVTLKHHILSVFIGFFIGSYLGVFGGGGATIVIFLLILIYGLSFHKAVANQKAVTLPISLIAAIIFMYQGLIDYRLGIPLFFVNMLGGYVGAVLILKIKPVWLKAVLVPLSILLGLKLIFF